MPAEVGGAYRSVFLRSPMPMWVFDAESLQFLDVNEAALRQYGYSRDEFLAMSIRDIRPPADTGRLEEYLESVQGDGEDRVAGGFVHRRKDGTLLDVELTSSAISFQDRPARLVLASDVTDRTHHERQLRALADASAEIATATTLQEALQILTDRAREILEAHLAIGIIGEGDWSAATTALSLSSRYSGFTATTPLHDGSGIYSLVRESREPLRLTQAELEAHPRRRGFGVAANTHPPLRGLLAAPLLRPDGWPMGIVQLSDKDHGDFTAADESMVVHLARAATDAIERGQLHRALVESQRRMDDAFQAASVGTYEWDLERGTVQWGGQLNRLLGTGQADSGGTVDDFLARVHPEDRSAVASVIARARKERQAYDLEYRIVRPDGTSRWMMDRGRFEHDDNGSARRVRGIVMDVTAQRDASAEIARLNQRLTHQLDRLDGLRQIDRAITSSLDLNLTLSVFLDQVTAHLGVDAAAVLLHDPTGRTLQYAGVRGVKSTSLRTRTIRMGDGTPGLAALERRAQRVLLGELGAKHPLLTALRAEGFALALAYPLVTKGHVVGVLELFHRSSFELDADRGEFLETLLDQGAIVIDNGVLFGKLERSNQELVQAYDTTIEGWATALDRRGRDPAGHSRRVTSLTVGLAQRLGISDAELHWVRRGALLHDVGNLDVPDLVLQKPGALTEEEWVHIRRHPGTGRDLIAHIPFLRRAMDIPYGHHERWDGSGYPQGLTGETIPLPARIFAVVDVYDAMTAGRPYAPPYSRADTVSYLRKEAGTLFDPRITDAFLRMLESPPSARM